MVLFLLCFLFCLFLALCFFLWLVKSLIVVSDDKLREKLVANSVLRIDPDGTKRYFKEDSWVSHREDGPAIEHPNGDKSWYINGKLHREDGPAVECYGGHKVWLQEGKLHRLDGPAREYANGDKQYYINDVNYTEAEYWYIIKNNLYILI